MSARSALYVGTVVHRRLRPRPHAFRYRAFWLLIDLDELPDLSSRLRLFSHNRGNLFSLRDADHGDGSTTPLRRQLDRTLSAAGIDPAGGTILLLCMPRTLGYGFNPISVYFCRRADGTPAALVYQVHNTFGERHSYVIPVDVARDVHHQTCRKTLYVSPFMDMDMTYEFRVAGPADRVAIEISGGDAGGPIIDTCLAGARRDLTDGALLRVFLAMPAITLKVIAAIHWEALRLWLKGLRPRIRPAPPDRLLTVAPASSMDQD